MRLALIGSGSTRLPLMLGSVAQAARHCALTDVVLYDLRPERTAALLPVARALASACGPLPPVRVAGTPEEALEGVAAAIFTVRPGFEEARAHDERACLRAGVLGQETTGPAGLAFATRSVPVVLQYCRIAAARSPGFLPVVFTNPAGMVAQALCDEGFDRAVGICDSATVAAKAVAARAGVPFADVDFEVHGLNHLSWTRRVEAAGRDLLGPALADPAFLRRLVPWWSAGTPGMGRIPNEYLYYWYRTDAALNALQTEEHTRGEGLATANAALLADLARLSAGGRVAEGLVRYAAWLSGRNESYMDYARGGQPRGEAPAGGIAAADAAVEYLRGQTGGYAEVALELLAGRTGAGSRRMALNVPSRGALPGLDDGDVVECDCEVGLDGVRPRPRGALPADDLALMTRVKTYERLGIRALREGRPDLLADALAAHPLVDRRDLADRLMGVLEWGPTVRRASSRPG
jgi:6-phospho-beta-glucosidase